MSLAILSGYGFAWPPSGASELWESMQGQFVHRVDLRLGGCQMEMQDFQSLVIYFPEATFDHLENS